MLSEVPQLCIKRYTIIYFCALFLCTRKNRHFCLESLKLKKKRNWNFLVKRIERKKYLCAYIEIILRVCVLSFFFFFSVSVPMYAFVPRTQPANEFSLSLAKEVFHGFSFSRPSDPPYGNVQLHEYAYRALNRVVSFNCETATFQVLSEFLITSLSNFSDKNSRM